MKYLLLQTFPQLPPHSEQKPESTHSLHLLVATSSPLPYSLYPSHSGLLQTSQIQQAWASPRAFAPAFPSAWSTLLPDTSTESFLSLRSSFMCHLLCEAHPDHLASKYSLASLPFFIFLLALFIVWHLFCLLYPAGSFCTLLLPSGPGCNSMKQDFCPCCLLPYPQDLKCGWNTKGVYQVSVD